MAGAGSRVMMIPGSPGMLGQGDTLHTGDSPLAFSKEGQQQGQRVLPASAHFSN